jgi:hypothetical protein
MHATANMRRASRMPTTEVAASRMASAAADMGSRTNWRSVRRRAALWWRRVGAVGQNDHESENDGRLEICHGNWPAVRTSGAGCSADTQNG